VQFKNLAQCSVEASIEEGRKEGQLKQMILRDRRSSSFFFSLNVARWLLLLANAIYTRARRRSISDFIVMSALLF
jgi:hypothetical protein